MQSKLPTYLFLFPTSAILLGMFEGYFGIVNQLQYSVLTPIVAIVMSLVGLMYKHQMPKLILKLIAIVFTLVSLMIGKYIMHMYFFNEVLHEGKTLAQHVKLYVVFHSPVYFPSFIRESEIWWNGTIDSLLLILTLIMVQATPILEDMLMKRNSNTALDDKDHLIDKKLRRSKRKSPWSKS